MNDFDILELMHRAMAEHVSRGGRIVFRTPAQYAELLRTRIEPGADPRAKWRDDSNDKALRAWSPDCAVFETCEKRPRIWSLDGVLDRKSTMTLSGPHRYVPQDVVRWRDPIHRAEIMRRAAECA